MTTSPSPAIRLAYFIHGGDDPLQPLAACEHDAGHRAQEEKED